MNEFEKEMLTLMKSMDSRLTNIETRVSNIESNIKEMKEDLEITRTAANYNGEKLEELADELKKMNVIS